MLPPLFLLTVLTSLFFGFAIIPSWGGDSDPAVTWVILGLVLVTLAFARPRWLERLSLPLTWAHRAAVVGVAALTFAAAFSTFPLLYAQGDVSLARAARWAFFGVSLTYALGLVREESRPLRLARFVLLGALVAVSSVQTVRISPAPVIDVWTVQQSGAEALASGKNPFQVVALKDTGPREAADVPYVYPPLHLLVSTPSWWLTGDVRYTMVLAILVAGFLLRALSVRTSEGRYASVLEDLPALCVWSMLMLPFLVEQGWIDPVPLAWLCALALAARRKWLAAVLCGLVIGGKQTMVLVVAPIGLALGLSLAQWVAVAAVAIAPIAPWALLDFRAWKHANFDFLNALPLRDDALTVISWARRRLHLTIPPVAGFVTAASVLLTAFVRRRLASLEQATLAAAAAMAWFFAFNKWAFANYYFTLAGLAAVAAAANLKPASPPP